MIGNMFKPYSLVGENFYQPTNKRVIDPIVGAAAIYAGASFLGNLFGSKNTEKANRANIALAQMNNEFNEHMFDRQIDYNWDMWNATNEYNAASSQRERLEDAGLNPYLMMNGGDAGTAQGGNAVSPPTAQAAQVQPFLPDFSGVAQAAEQLADYEIHKKGIQADNDKKVAEARMAQSDATFKDAVNANNLIKLIYDTGDSHEKWVANYLKNQVTIKSFDELARRAFLENRVLETQEDLNISQKEYYSAASALANEQVKYVAPQALARIATEASEQARNYAEGGKARVEAIESVKRTIETETRTKGIQFDNDVKEVDSKCKKAAENMLIEAAKHDAATKSNTKARERLESENDFRTTQDNEGIGRNLRWIKRNAVPKLW